MINNLESISSILSTCFTGNIILESYTLSEGGYILKLHNTFHNESFESFLVTSIKKNDEIDIPQSIRETALNAQRVYLIFQMVIDEQTIYFDDLSRHMRQRLWVIHKESYSIELPSFYNMRKTPWRLFFQHILKHRYNTIDTQRVLKDFIYEVYEDRFILSDTEHLTREHMYHTYFRCVDIRSKMIPLSSGSCLESLSRGTIKFSDFSKLLSKTIQEVQTYFNSEKIYGTLKDEEFYNILKRVKVY